MAFLAEEQNQKQVHEVMENSEGMTLLNVLAVGTSGFYIGTPVKAAAALGTALGRLERRTRRSVEWDERRNAGKEAGEKLVRKRGKGAQLRRKLRRQQQAINKWREQHPMQPGVTRAEPQSLGCTRLLMQLTKAKMGLSTAERQVKNLAAELEQVKTKKSAPAQQQCQKFDVYLLENYFAYVH